jgi:hypothetical protein
LTGCSLKLSPSLLFRSVAKMGDSFDELFREAMPLYPGSKTVIRSARTGSFTVSKAIDLFDPLNWGHKPITKTVGGKDVDLYTFGALCAALDRPPVTVRLWETNGYLPTAPFRAEHIPGKGGTSGRRYYPLEAIQAAIEEFFKRGLLGASRVEWSQHEDLTAAIADRWSQIVESFHSAPSN